MAGDSLDNNGIFQTFETSSDQQTERSCIQLTIRGFFPRHMARTSVLRKLRMRKQNTNWTWRQSVVPNDVPRDFGPVIAFGAKVHIPLARQ